MKNKRLLYLLIALAILLGVIYYIDDKPDAVQFDTVLCNFEPEAVTMIELHLPNAGMPVTIYTGDKGWDVRIDGREYMANESRIKLLKNSFSDLEAMRIVANNDRNWADYHLDTERAAAISFSDGTDNLCKIYTGRLGFDQAKSTSNTYVRKADDEKTYLVADNLSAQVNIDPASLISPLVTGNYKTEMVTSVELIHNTQTLWRWSLIESERLWLNEHEQKAAIEKIENYLTTLSRMVIDKFDLNQRADELTANYTIRLGFEDNSSLKLHIASTDEFTYLSSSYRTDQIVFTISPDDPLLTKLLQTGEDFLPETVMD